MRRFYWSVALLALFDAQGGLKLVTTASDVLMKLRRSAFPEDDTAEDTYPNNIDRPVVDIPYGSKATNCTIKEKKK